MRITHQPTISSKTTALDLVSRLSGAYGDQIGFCVIHHCADHLPTVEKRIFVCLEPVLKLEGQVTCELVTTPGTETVHRPCSALMQLQKQLQTCTHLPALPLLTGYFSYEFLHTIESISRPARDPFRYPDYQFFLYRQLVEISLSPDIAPVSHIFSFEEYPTPFWVAATPLESLARVPEVTLETEIEKKDGGLAEHSNFSREKYLQTIERIRSHIEAGDVYQVNLSQCFSLPFAQQPWQVYLAAIQSTFTAQGAFLNTQNLDAVPIAIISQSPETFFHIQGNSLITSPIKGTISRQDLGDDSKAIQALQSSPKDNAELAMIVDLLRNDLGKVAIPGTVIVREHARVQSLTHVHHLVSDITATIPDSSTALAVINALFPCGSITGAPKVAAMELIATLEDQHRGIYTGSIGFFAPGGDAAFSVAIRTATVLNGSYYIQVGGGIVYPSSPAAEYEETLVKARSLLTAYWSLQKSRSLSEQTKKCSPAK